MIRLLAVCFALTWMIGCQCQPRAPIYDPFASSGQRIAPPATGSLNQPGGYYQAPAPTYAQPVPGYAPQGYAPQGYAPAPNYQPPASFAPAIQQPQIPPGFVPVQKTSSTVPAELSPISRTASTASSSYASTNRSVPTPKPTANWPPKKQIRRAEVLSWDSPGFRNVQQATATSPIYAQSTPTVIQPTVFWNDQCVDCDPYATPHIVNPLLPQPAVYAEAHQDYSNVIYSADQSYGDNWRPRSSRRE